MALHRYIRAQDDDQERPPQMTTMEKVANSLLTVLIARGAMVAMPFVASALVWFGSSWLDQRFDQMARSLDAVGSRVETLESDSDATVRRVTEHEFRLDTGKAQREAFQADVVKQFEKLEQTLSENNEKLLAIDDSVIKLGTIIAERVPRRESMSQP
jgi:hypothetical protein